VKGSVLQPHSNGWRIPHKPPVTPERRVTSGGTRTLMNIFRICFKVSNALSTFALKIAGL